MAVLLDEKWLTALQYDDADWTEQAGVGATVDEGVAGPGGEPAEWGSYCIKIIAPGTNNAFSYNTLAGDEPDVYIRIEFILTAESMGNWASIYIANIKSSAPALAFQIKVAQDAPDYRLYIESYHDGNANSYNADSVNPISLNTRYRLEFKWLSRNGGDGSWAWKVNGVEEDNGVLDGTSVTSIRTITIGDDSATPNGWTGYFDLIKVDDADWVGAEAGGLSIPVAMHHYKQRRRR